MRTWLERTRAEIIAGETVIASGEIAGIFFIPLGAGERLDIGRDTGVTVVDYPTPQGHLEGDVPYLKLLLD